MLRWSMLLLAAACAGGQTGEITDLAACREPIGVASIDERSAAGRSARAQLDALTTETVAVSDDDAYALSVSFALTGEPATLLGGPECARPWLEAPVTIDLSTSDGALDGSIEGVVLLTDADAATAYATDGALRIDLVAEPARLSGQLTESDDDRLLTTF